MLLVLELEVAGAGGLEAAEVLLGVPRVRLALLDQTRIRETGAP